MGKLTLETLEKWLWDLEDLMRGLINRSNFRSITLSYSF